MPFPVDCFGRRLLCQASAIFNNRIGDWPSSGCRHLLPYTVFQTKRTRPCALLQELGNLLRMMYRSGSAFHGSAEPIYLLRYHRHGPSYEISARPQHIEIEYLGIWPGLSWRSFKGKNAAYVNGPRKLQNGAIFLMFANSPMAQTMIQDWDEPTRFNRR